MITRKKKPYLVSLRTSIHNRGKGWTSPRTSVDAVREVNKSPHDARQKKSHNTSGINFRSRLRRISIMAPSIYSPHDSRQSHIVAWGGIKRREVVISDLSCPRENCGKNSHRIHAQTQVSRPQTQQKFPTPSQDKRNKIRLACRKKTN